MERRPSHPPVFEIRPFGMGVRTGSIPFNVSWPFPRSLAVYEEGLNFRMFSSETWVPRECIILFLRGPGYVRVKWIRDDEEASATAGDWFRMRALEAGLIRSGYRLERTLSLL